ARRSASGEGAGWVTSQGWALQSTSTVANLRLSLSTTSHLGVAYKEERHMARRGRTHAAGATAGLVAVGLALAGCGSTNEYEGEFTVANGDSSFYVGEMFRHDTVTVTCTEKRGTVTATITESRTGNE